MKHDHGQECEHILKFCKKCDEVECENCEQVWGKQVQSTFDAGTMYAPIAPPVVPTAPASNNPFMPENPNKVFATIK